MLAFYLKLYFCALAVFFAIDIAWLAFVARGFYQKHLGFLMRSPPQLGGRARVLPVVRVGADGFRHCS